MSRRKLFHLLAHLIVVFSVLAQTLSGIVTASSPAAEASPSTNLPQSAPASPTNNVRDATPRPAWTRPEIETISFAPVEPPVPTASAPAASPLPAAPPAPYPFGNNNLGRTYKDTNNPEDHPGRHFAGPVNLINGNLFLTVGDHFFAATGLSVQLARSFNSFDIGVPGPFGNGWTHSYHASAFDDVATVTIRNGDGSLHVYTWNGLSYDPPPGIFRNLIHTPGDPASPFILEHKSGIVEVFGPQAVNGRLEQIIDRNGNAIQLFYDGLNRLTEVVAPDGTRRLVFNYYLTTPDLVESVVDPIGRITFYQYDSAGNLTNVFYPEGTTAVYNYDAVTGQLTDYTDPRQPRGSSRAAFGYAGINADDPVTSVNYGSSSGFSLVFLPNITQWIDSQSQLHQIQYDSDFHIITDQMAFSGCGGCFRGEAYTYYGNHLLQSKQDANGHTTQYDYDAQGNMLRTTSPSGAVTRFRYDPVYNNVISTTNPAGETILYQYDTSGNLVRETAPLGRVITYTHDSAGNLTGITDPLGHPITYTYDVTGNLTTVIDPDGFQTTFSYDPIGRVTRKTDPSGNVTRYDYDAVDRLVQVTDPLNGTIRYTYDTNGNLLTLTDANSHTITHTYDVLDRLTVITDTLGNSTRYQYDSAGRLVTRTDPDGLATTYTYDEAGRMLTRDAGTRQDTFTYDPAGNMVSMSDGAYTTTITYDPENRPTNYVLDGVSVTKFTTVTYSYDPMGNRTGTLLDDGTTTWQTTYSYDSLNRLVQTKDDSGRTWTTTYDAMDQRTTLTLPDLSHVEYEYDRRGNLTGVLHYDPGNVLERSYTYAYDGLSNVITENDNGITSTHTYDALSRVSETTTAAGSVTYSYDPVGNRISVLGPSGEITSIYDPGNRLLSSDGTTYTYGSMGQRLSDTGTAGTRNYTYDAEMRLTQVELVDTAFTLRLDYDPLGRLIQKQDSDGNETLLLHGDGRFEAELEPTGDLRRTFTIDTEIIAMNLVSAAPVVVDYHYDGNGRVRWVTEFPTRTIVAEYTSDPSVDHASFYNPIRVNGLIFLPEVGLYLVGDGQVWDPVAGVFLFRFWPWVFWPFNPFHPLIPIFRYWPWAWPWATPWGFPWPSPWPFLWPWPGVWIRPFLLWPMWPWPAMPWVPWWWWWHWWGWGAWGHWWWWHPWWWWQHWWLWGWWFWGWWGWNWWLWWWWPWWWWWPCWWIWGWWWWRWRWWWWHWWGWRWWWPWWRWWRWWWCFPPPWIPPPPVLLPAWPDFGDAPDPAYPSLRASNGARHLNPAYEWLGPSVDREFDAQVVDLDAFDDGVAIDLPNGLVTFTVTTAGNPWRYNALAPLHVHGWIDYNGNGAWDHPSELVVNWSGYPGDGIWPLGAPSFTVGVPMLYVPPPATLPANTWARFRLDYAQNRETPVGPAWYGEVEDDPLSIVVPVVVGTAVLAGTDVVLSWMHNAANCSYEVYSSPVPYFTPGTPIWVVPAPGNTYTAVGDAGNPAVNHFYIVRAVSCVSGGPTADSGEVGEFDFSIVPGS